jgi:SulP family sulfate permease
VVAYSVYGTLFFGAIHKLEALLDPAERHPEVVILEMQHLVSMDTTGMEGLESLCKNLHKRGCALILCNLNTQPESLIRRSGFGDEVGPNNLCSDIYGALARARQLLPRLPMKTTLKPRPPAAHPRPRAGGRLPQRPAP